ncbi:MAG: hypothetical protein QG622_232 [Actinomycetota bacterium]|nr:hypothetical protein [Actinomycetota bacterium]
MGSRYVGQSRGERFDWYVRTIYGLGWAVAHAEGAGRAAGYSHTVGLTRFHGHPELLVSGLEPDDAGRLLGELAASVRAGAWLDAGVMFGADTGHTLQLADVADPQLMADAQLVYASEAGFVPGLQVIWSDQSGNWPWDPSWLGTDQDQPLFGHPLHL